MLQLGSLPGSPLATPLTVWQSPDEDVGAHWVIHAPAFAEEMNKSRHMVARQARRFAASGHTVVVPDLCGTGDSAHSLEVATWQGWVDELCAVVDWAREKGARSITLWGLRLGCLLALEAAVRLGERAAPPNHLLLWQPLLAGKLQMAQFLRLVTAAAVTRGGEGQTAASVKAALAEGNTVEVAGYPLSAALYAGIQAADAATHTLPARTAVTVLEVAAQVDKPLLPVTARHLSSWQEAGLVCTARTVLGDAFWATQELGFADALLMATEEALAATGPVSPSPPTSEKVISLALAIADAPSEGGTLPTVFTCQGAQLAGRVHVPENRPAPATGVVIVVGGPQYRVGSHRQFVALAESLADAGYPVLRFDYRGMGDSEGELSGFTAIHEDIAAAIDALQVAVPSVERVALWGLCDAATAAVVYAGHDTRVAGLVLANPWVYSEQGAASVKIRHYYARRIFSPTFWGRFFSGRVSLFESVADFLQAAARARSSRAPGSSSADERRSIGTVINTCALGAEFLEGLKAFRRPVLLLLSGNDFTALEFQRAVDGSSAFRLAMAAESIQTTLLADADHTFSTKEWQKAVEAQTLAFLADM